MLDLKTFKMVIQNTPLVSIDLCLIFDGKIILCKRTNDPLKGEWFTPGGRIYKNETWQNALVRIAEVELDLSGVEVEDFSLMGVWDHFYSSNGIDQSISTHYVNLPHYAVFKSAPQITLDKQHNEYKWFDLNHVSNDIILHPYIRNYASWLLNKI